MRQDAQNQARVPGLRQRKTGWRGHCHQHRTTTEFGLFDQFAGTAGRQQREAAVPAKVGPQHRSDQLVEGVVSSDILADQLNLAVDIAERGRMDSAGQAVEQLMFGQHGKRMEQRPTGEAISTAKPKLLISIATGTSCATLRHRISLACRVMRAKRAKACPGTCADGGDRETFFGGMSCRLNDRMTKLRRSQKGGRDKFLCRGH